MFGLVPFWLVAVLGLLTVGAGMTWLLIAFVGIRHVVRLLTELPLGERLSYREVVSKYRYPALLTAAVLVALYKNKFLELLLPEDTEEMAVVDYDANFGMFWHPHVFERPELLAISLREYRRGVAFYDFRITRRMPRPPQQRAYLLPWARGVLAPAAG